MSRPKVAGLVDRDAGAVGIVCMDHGGVGVMRASCGDIAQHQSGGDRSPRVTSVFSAIAQARCCFKRRVGLSAIVSAAASTLR